LDREGGGMRIFKFNSIKKKFLVVTSCLLITIFGTVGFFMAIRTSDSLRQSLSSKGAAIIDLTSLMSTEYMENMNLTGVDNLSANIIQDPEVAFVAFYDEQKHVLIEKQMPQETSPFLVLEKELKSLYDNRILGSVKIGFRKDSISKSLLVNIFTVAVSMAVGIVLFTAGILVLLRGIVRPLDQCVNVSEKLANGELDMEIQVETGDETGKMMAALMSMVQKLREIVSSVKTAADNVYVGSQEQSGVS
jgi:methyl-accepting chemotaxis protein